MADKPLFRKAALDRLASPERLDVLMRVTSPQTWVALVVTAALLAGIVAWSVVGSVPTRVVGEGILIRGGGLREIRASGDGVLSSLSLAVNEAVASGKTVGVISAGASADEAVRAARERYEQAARDYAATRAEDAATIEGVRATMAAHQADITRAEAELARVTDDLAAKREALKKGLIVASRVQAIERDVVSMQANLTGLRAAVANDQANIRAIEQRGRAKAGDVEAARLSLAQMTATTTQSSHVISTVAGRVVEIKRRAGDRVQAGDVIAIVEPPSTTLEPVVFVDSNVGKRITPGMEAQVAPSTVKREEYGFMLGRVQSVGDYPVTPEAAMATVANSALVQEFLAAGPRLEMRASLVPDASTPSEYRWSSSKGPPFKVEAGTRVLVSVIVDRRSPISFVLPIVRRTLGTR